MMMDPLPDLDKVFSILIQQERQLVLQFDDSRVFSQLDTNNGTYGRGRGCGGHTSGGRGKGKSTKMCNYCNKSGHMVDTCYKKHGYPPHLHRGGAINQYSIDDQEIQDDLQSLG